MKRPIPGNSGASTIDTQYIAAAAVASKNMRSVSGPQAKRIYKDSEPAKMPISIVWPL